MKNGDVGRLRIDVGLARELSFCFRETFQVFSGELHDSPVFSEASSQSLIHVYSGRVPVKNLPSHSVTVLRDGDPCEIDHQSFADAFASELRPDKKVFQEQSVPSLPCGVVMEKEGHSARFAIRLSNNHSELGIRRETISHQVVFRSSNRTGFAFILRQLADEGQNQGDVFNTCLANFQHGFRTLTLSPYPDLLAQ